MVYYKILGVLNVRACCGGMIILERRDKSLIPRFRNPQAAALKPKS